MNENTVVWDPVVESLFSFVIYSESSSLGNKQLKTEINLKMGIVSYYIEINGKAEFETHDLKLAINYYNQAFQKNREVL